MVLFLFDRWHYSAGGQWSCTSLAFKATQSQISTADDNK